MTALGPTQVTLYLLLYGIAAAVGTLLGGRAADANANLTLVSFGVVVALALALLHYAGTSPALVVVGLTAWGVAGWGLVPSLQYRTVTLAGPRAGPRGDAARLRHHRRHRPRGRARRLGDLGVGS